MFAFLKLLLAAVPLAAFLILAAGPAAAAPKHLFKVAYLAPEGSIWANRFLDFAAEVEKATNGEVGFKVYPGGVMGDDRAVYRKMRIGQLQGGGMTMIGMGEVVPDFRVMGIPFLFDSYDEVDRVAAGLWPRLEEAFAAKDLELLALSEVGFLYALSAKPVTTIEGLRQAKSWIPEGDPISRLYLETLGVHATPLSIPDVLTSLQTGMIDTVFNSFYGAIVLQWFTATKFVTDLPFAYSYGAFALDRKSFSQLSAEQAALVKKSARQHFTALVADTRASNEEALRTLQANGLTVVAATPETAASCRAHRETVVNQLVGSAFSKEIYEETMRLLTGTPPAASSNSVDFNGAPLTPALSPLRVERGKGLALASGRVERGKSLALAPPHPGPLPPGEREKTVPSTSAISPDTVEFTPTGIGGGVGWAKRSVPINFCGRIDDGHAALCPSGYSGGLDCDLAFAALAAAVGAGK